MKEPKLHPCFWYRVTCRFCHSVNLALQAPLAHKTGMMPCPHCTNQAKFVFVGKGRTTYPLPFHEIVSLIPTGRDFGRVN